MLMPVEIVLKKLTVGPVADEAHGSKLAGTMLT